ncbi:MAG: DegV family protein [Anaerolineae bacterium]
MIGLVTDSTCDLPEDFLAGLDVHVVPMSIRFGTREYLEGETLDYGEFYNLVDQLGIVPKTSQPAPGRFVEIYRQLAAEGVSVILSLHITGKLSGTVQSATLAAGMVRDQVEVRVFDSLAGSAGMGYMILEAAELIERGESPEAVLGRWAEIRDSLSIAFMMDTLRYARMSGRVGALQSTLASMLQVKPIIKLRQGSLELAERVRTRSAALNRLLDRAVDEFGCRPLNIAVVHAEALDSASALLAEAQSRLDCRRVFVARLAPSLVANLGPGTLGLVAYPAPGSPQVGS